MNPYITSLSKSLSLRYSVESTGMTTGDWLTENTFHKGDKFNFKGYEFQRAIADDLHPNLDVLKISQVGLTEIQMRKALALCKRNVAWVGIFSLPNALMYRRFYQSRMKPVLDANAIFNPPEDSGSTRSMDLVQFGQSFLHIVNATEGSATSTSADFVFNDEVDLSDQKILSLFASRLQNSPWKIRQRFSTPTWQGFGIDATYSVSDQREYFCRCHACRHWQVPLWDTRWVKIPGLPESMKLDEINDDIMPTLDLGGALVVCERCGGPLDLDDLGREWVASYPSRLDARGYRVRPFSSGRITIPYIVKELLSYRRTDFIRGWWNTVIGEPYSDVNARLSEESIRACFRSEATPEIGSTVPVYIGVDMGMGCHVTLGTIQGGKVNVFEFRVVSSKDIVDYVREVDKRYNLVAGACDRHPYTPTAEEMRDATGGKLMPVEYRGEVPLKPVTDLEEAITHWQMNRTRGIDDVAKRVRTRGYEFNGYGTQQRLIIEHLRDMVREEKPEKPAVWTKLNGVDHYFHSLAFLETAMKLSDATDSYNQSESRQTVFFGGFDMRQPRGLKARDLYY